MNIILSHLSPYTNHVTYTKAIIEVIIKDISWNPQDFEEQIYDNVMLVFMLNPDTVTIL